jgi:membrane fusion protein, copper/silver efflux system
MKKTTALLCWMSLIAAPTIGCTSTIAAPAAAEAGLSTAQVERMQAALSEYEALRAALAADRLADVGALSAKVQSSATAANADVPASVGTRLTQMATAAGSLKAGGSPDEQRRVFGELSRAVVALIAENPKLGVGRKVFMCPMAQGYQKWVQTGEQVENPYMGAKMLRCGSASDWTP